MGYVIRLLSMLIISILFSCSEKVSNQKLEDLYSILDKKIVSLQGRAVSLKDFFSHSQATLSFISLSCEHCYYQTEVLIANHAEKPDSLQLAFIADVHPDSLSAFAASFTYDTSTTVFLQDKNGELAQQMGVTSYPTMFLYDTAGVHLQTIVGEAKPAYVYKFFHEPH